MTIKKYHTLSVGNRISHSITPMKVAKQQEVAMKIGFLGAGKVTGTFGRHLINAGHTIVVSNSRGPATLADFVADLGPGAIAGTREQAAECDVVILAVHWGESS
jgi:glutamyl-tRNA reductase